MSSSLSLPRVSIITPSFNQAEFLEETLLSILNQDYPNIEYIVMDGGSTDGSVDIIKAYGHRLAYWESSPDRGQYDAINKGLQRATGEILGWLNSDDILCPWGIRTAVSVFQKCPQVDWLTSSEHVFWSRVGLPWCVWRIDGYSRRSFYRGRNLLRDHYFRFHTMQEVTFWRRTLWARSGARMDPDLKVAGDFELWARFWQHTELACVHAIIGGFRHYGEQKSTAGYQNYLREARSVLQRYGEPAPPSPQSVRWRQRLLHYLPILGPILGERSMHVEISPVDGECSVFWKYIV